MSQSINRWCPYCGYQGSEDEVDDHMVSSYDDDHREGPEKFPMKHRPQFEEENDVVG